MDFGKVINLLKSGEKMVRSGWNGKGIYIKLQVPDTHSKMTSPYIYINSTGVRTDNPDALKVIIPWIPSQTDIFAEDWFVVVE